MPLLEVVRSAAGPLDVERKRAFAREAVAVFGRVLATPPGRLRLAFRHLAPDDGVGLLAGEPGYKAGGPMLVLQVTMLAGRAAEQKAALIGELSAAAVRHLDHPAADVRVIIYEVSGDDWGIGGRSVAAREGDVRR